MGPLPSRWLLPPYVVASDRTLRELAKLRPRTLDELRLAHGIGPHKVQRYGAGLLAVVAQTLAALPPAGHGPEPTALHLRRSEALLADPPSAAWDGVYLARTK